MISEWYDETLVAIAPCTNNKFEVWELPMRQRSTARRSNGHKPQFRTFEKAQAYIDTQYQNVLQVTPDDILEEMKLREAVQNAE